MPKKGYKQTEEHKRKHSEFLKGKLSNALGKHWKLSDETKIKNSEARKKEWAEGKRIPLMLGKKHTEKTKEKMRKSAHGFPLSARINAIKASKQRRREKHCRWIKDRSLLQRYNDVNKERRSSAYRDWRLQVYERDNWKCRINNKDCSGRIIAHHILSYTQFPELRYEINNGITLCQAHHPRKRAEEKQLIPFFNGLMSVSKV